MSQEYEAAAKNKDLRHDRNVVKIKRSPRYIAHCDV